MPVTSERSAGIIVFRFDSGMKEPQFLLLDYGKYWEYPKGHVERGEDDLAAAVRELEEETGIDDVEIVDGFEHEITYFFRDKRKGLVRKTVVFFLGHTHRQDVKISHEHVGADFLSYDEAIERLGFKNSKAALSAAKAFLDRATPV
jgi:8-oxo-dGTP pyrophosphatase MutT (NUDIX family)